MLNKEVLSLLNNQIWLENMSSYYYLKLSVLCNQNGFNGVSKFFLEQSNEEREHMMKIFNYMLEQDTEPVVPSYNYIEEEGIIDFNLLTLFENSLTNEKEITNSINELVIKCKEVGDSRTENFLSWFVEEQNEEEQKFKDLVEDLKIIKGDKFGLYHFNKSLK
jgi:ferritin